MSQAPDRLLPPDLIRAADLRLLLRHLNAEDLRSVAQSVTSDATDLMFAPEVCAAVSPVVLRLAHGRGSRLTISSGVSKLSWLAKHQRHQPGNPPRVTLSETWY
ncbi:hypothetical protein JMJ56_21840 [Belnapia sp. T18]|uniref:F-box domain-containing protein n=1 Tax=Belnapia arida TaxID=2804533 RepID=A0ABS1U7L9_9PROT|nr:hypothetical protein [Belnapia arida]MBL6080663.1 hypothetical protein [Belnapia arida]